MKSQIHLSRFCTPILDHLVIFRAVGHYDPPPPTQGVQRDALSSPNGFHFAIFFHIEPLLSYISIYHTCVFIGENPCSIHRVLQD